MHKGYVSLLLRKFNELSKSEVVQEVRIAEFLSNGRGDRLAFRIAQTNLLDLMRRLRRYTRLFPCEFVDAEKRSMTMLDTRARDEWLHETEWQEIMSGLPLPARKLAEFAKEESERFEDVPNGVWCRENVEELRRRVKRRYIEWDRSHSERSYLRARATLVAALRWHADSGNGKVAEELERCLWQHKGDCEHRRRRRDIIRDIEFARL